MRILLISAKADHPNGGIAIWTKHYSDACKNLDGFSCDLVNVALTGRRASCATARRSMIDEISRTWGIFRQLNEKLSNISYDVAHLNTSIGTFGIVRDYFIARRVARKGVPVVLHFHCDIPKWVTNCIVKHFLAKILKVSRVNLVLCDNSKRYLRDAFGVDSVKLPNFVDGNMIASSKEIHDHVQKVLFVGRVSVDKGAEEIFELAKLLPHSDFLLAGEVSNEVASWECPGNVVFLGIQEHDAVMSSLDDADVFFFPSHTEGFSLALAEAMARGVPAIATDVGANAEMLENQGGIVVPVGDIPTMEMAFEQIDEFNLRKKMSAWNLKKVRERYETKQVMRVLTQTYENVMEKNGK